MADLIAIVESDPRKRETSFRAAVEAFRVLRGLDPAGVRERGCASLAVYRKTHGQDPLLEDTGTPPSGVIAVIGSWLPEDGEPGGVGSALAAALSGAADGRVSDVPLDGVFAALLVAGPDRAIAVTDRVGSLHVYWTRVGSGFAVSTSSTVLAVLRSASWDLTGVSEFLGLGTIYEDRSLHAGVSKLGPATVATFRPGNAQPTLAKYWEVHAHAWREDRPSTDAEGVFEELRAAVERLARRYPRPLFDLTGGYDSRVLFAAAREANVPLATVVNGPPDSADVISANRIARTYRVDHRHQTLPEDWQKRWWGYANRAVALADGEYNALEYARTIYFQERLASGFAATVNGSGGELCRGYWWELLYPRIGRPGAYDATQVAAKRYAFSDGALDLLDSSALAGGVVPHVAGIMDRTNQAFADLPNTAAMDNVYLTLRMHRWQGRLASATNRIWPCLAPFLLRAPMEAAIGAAPDRRVRSRMASDMLEMADRRLADLPMADGFPASRMRLGNLHRFAPLATYYAAKVYDKTLGRVIPRAPGASRPGASLVGLVRGTAVQDCLHASSWRTRELYDPSRLAEFVEAQKRAPSEDRLGRVLTLELLARRMSEMSSAIAAVRP